MKWQGQTQIAERQIADDPVFHAAVFSGASPGEAPMRHHPGSCAMQQTTRARQSEQALEMPIQTTYI